MKTKQLLYFVIGLLFFFSAKAEKPVIIYHFTLNQEIDKSAYRLVKKAINEAENQHADYILMTLNTYGGMLDAADSIRTKILNAKPTTIVWINNNAASAGALISIACDSIYMREGASIGAATVVDEMGNKQMDKYQSYMRSMMRSTAESNHRDPLIAEAMVDESVVVPGISDSAHILTFTAQEAMKNKYCEGIAENETMVLHQMHITSYKIIEHQISFTDHIISFLLNPFINSLLILMIFGGIYFEMKAPGLGLPSIVAIIGAILYFAPLYLDGLAANWEILIFVVGLILLALEIFVIPGFGIVGILGIIFVIAGLTLSLIDNDMFHFHNNVFDVIGKALFRVTITIIIGMVLAATLGGSIFNFPVFNRMVLKSAQKSEHGYSIRQNEMQVLIGKEGVAISDLRPSGKVELEGNIYDAISDAEYILKNTPVVVSKVTGYSLRVKKIKTT